MRQSIFYQSAENTGQKRIIWETYRLQLEIDFDDIINNSPFDLEKKNI